MTFMTDLDNAIHKSLYTNINLKPKQVVCLEAIYNNKDTVAILPTGYGKSLIYQLLPPLLSKRRSTLSDVEKAVVLVISPLNSLIDDQIKKINDCSEIRATVLSVSGHHMKDDVCEISENVDGLCDILFLHPEACLSSKNGLTTLNSNLYQKHVQAIVIDEAHCLLEW
jgi:superfamily II DNA helicase RecQ